MAPEVILLERRPVGGGRWAVRWGVAPAAQRTLLLHDTPPHDALVRATEDYLIRAAVRYAKVAQLSRDTSH